MGLRDRIKSWLGIVEAPGGGAKGGGSAKRDPSQMIIKKVGLATKASSGGGGGRDDFESPDFDLTQVKAAYDTDGYVRQALDKYIEFMFKAGYEFVGKNPNAVDYIKMRLALMAEATEIPVDILFISIAEDVVKYSNAIVAKSRDQAAGAQGKGVGITYQGLGGNPPIAGYFPQNPTTFEVKRDKNGAIKQWQQNPPDSGGGGDSKGVKFKPEDIVHIPYKRERGAAFGTPFCIPVLDDVRALRQAEENVLKMLYRNVYPFWHFQVGLQQEGFQGTDLEIDATRREIEMMDLEGGLVTSERVNVKAIAADKIVDALPYLKFFEARVFTGLGVSELMMGRGNTANRSTGDNLAGEFVDRIKAIQKVISIYVDERMIKELLMEGGFDPVLNPDDMVNFRFSEIDVDTKIKMENHAIFQYEHNAIDENEMRLLLGRDPITDRAFMFMNLVTIPVAEATAQAKAAVAGTGTPSANNKNKPTNQHGTKPSPKKKASASTAFYYAVKEQLDELEAGIQAVVENHYRGGPRVLERLDKVAEGPIGIVNMMVEQAGLDPAAARKFTLAAQRFVDGTRNTVQSIQHSEDALDRATEVVKAMYDVTEQKLTDIVATAYPATGGEEDDE